MAHYIAELMHSVETAGPEDRPAKLAQCAAAILEIWNHRHQLPDGKRPFRDFDGIFRTLESLDPNSTTSRYFSPIRKDANTEGAESEKWLAAAKSVDGAARMLIRYCIARAAETASDESEGWISNAESSGVGDGIDLQIIRLINREQNPMDPDALEAMARKAIEEKIQRLEHLNEVTAVLKADYKRQLGDIESPAVP
jgi:hypothetical protein